MLNKAKRIIKNKKNACIIMDFDYTLTDYSSFSSIGVFSNYLCSEYVKKKKIIDRKVECSDDDNTQELYELWKEKIILLNKYSNKRIVNKIVKDNNFVLRDELIDFLKFSNENNIDVYIISSGCKEIIEKVLIYNKVNFNNIKLLANSFTKINDKVITPKNKREFFDKKYSFHIVLGDEKSDFFIKENAYYVEYFNDSKFRKISKYENKKCIYGLGLYKGKKIFYKTVHYGIVEEIKKYKLVSKYYKVPNIVTCNKNVIMYEYIEDFINKSIYDYLYKNHKLHINYELILNGYKKSLKNIKFSKEKKLKNSLFYKDRINTIDKYIDNKKYAKYKNVFIDIKNNISKEKKLHSFISQGDPCDTNITINGMFCDFENGGYNSLVGEIAIFIISILSHGAYIYPKYNSKVYDIRKSKKIKNNVSNKNKELLIKYLELYKNSLNKKIIKEIDKYLKYYICFRIITPIDINVMNKKDREKVLDELTIFYNTKNFDQIIKTIKEWNYEI